MGWNTSALFVAARKPKQLLPKIEIIFEDALTTLMDTKALVIILSSVMSTYGFLLFDDGALVRKVTYTYGKCVVNIGEPLAFEADFDEERGHDEDFIWTALREITGRGPDLGGIYDVYDVIMD